MSSIYPDISMLHKHTSLNISALLEQHPKIELLVTNKDKRIWHISVPEQNTQTSIVLKCSKRQRSFVEFQLYKGCLTNMTKFLPKTYGVWQEGEWYCIAMEYVHTLSHSQFLQRQDRIIDFAAQLHREFPADKMHADWLPYWSNFNPHNLGDYFTTLQKKSETELSHLPTKYREVIQKGMCALPDILKKTQKFPQSLLHRSLSENNTKIDDSGRIVLIDWEDAQVAPVVLDLVWLLEIKLVNDLKWSKKDDNPRRKVIETYLKTLTKSNDIPNRESFLIEYKIMYIYLVLTSLVWAYFRNGSFPAEYQCYLETFNYWVKELNLF